MSNLKTVTMKVNGMAVIKPTDGTEDKLDGLPIWYTPYMDTSAIGCWGITGLFDITLFGLFHEVSWLGLRWCWW